MHEWLASNGFVVVNTAYQSSKEKGVLNVGWDLELFKAEIDFVLDKIATYPIVDMQSIGIMGQSYGAQAALSYPLHTKYNIKGVLSLDSTMDYLYRCQSEGFAPLLKLLFANNAKLNMPVMIFAGEGATFAVMDSLIHAERHYICVKDQEHNDYISQGAIGVYLERAHFGRA